jgi:hypothetical protein
MPAICPRLLLARVARVYAMSVFVACNMPQSCRLLPHRLMLLLGRLSSGGRAALLLSAIPVWVSPALPCLVSIGCPAGGPNAFCDVIVGTALCQPG